MAFFRITRKEFDGRETNITPDGHGFDALVGYFAALTTAEVKPRTVRHGLLSTGGFTASGDKRSMLRIHRT